MKRAHILPFSSPRHAADPVRLGGQRAAPSPRAIKIQLSQILASEGFVHARRMRRFLEFVVEETLAGRTSQLCEYSIGICVFERDQSFQPALDPIVRNDARRLRQKLLEYYRVAGRESSVIIDIPKGSYVPAFRAALPNGAALSRPAHWRLTVSLTRLVDGVELWTSEHDFGTDEHADEIGFDLQLRASTVP